MKKTVSLLLCVVLMLAVFGGCAEKKHTLQIGYGLVDATPDYGIPIAGSGSGSGNVVATKAVDNLYITCLAITDETGKTILVYTLDLCYIMSGATLALRQVIEETGVPYDHIMLATNHSHSAPDMGASDKHAGAERYTESFREWMVEAAVAAMADRKTVTGISTAVTYPEKLNWVRHYILKDGSINGKGSQVKTANAAAHLYDADNELQLVKVAREGGKDILMMNWQGHPNGFSAGSMEFRSDVDVIRKAVEPELDCLLVYFLGASGDVNHVTKVKELREAEGVFAWNDYVGKMQKLAEYIIEADDTYQDVKVGPIRLLRSKCDVKSFSGEMDMQLTLDAFSLGDVAFIAAPYEMFGKNGMAIKEGSPFETTMVSTCTNGYTSYIPASYAFDYPCYEVGMNSYARGTAEQLVDAYLSMLKQIHENRFEATE